MLDDVNDQTTCHSAGNEGAPATLPGDNGFELVGSPQPAKSRMSV